MKKSDTLIIFILLCILVGCSSKGKQYKEIDDEFVKLFMEDMPDPSTASDEEIREGLIKAKYKMKMELTDWEYLYILVKHIANGEATKFAGMSYYPIKRTYPFPHIEDSAQMVRYFDMMADDSLKQVCLNLKLDDIESFAWEGYSFLGGRYLLNTGTRILINYQSEKEKNIMASLYRQEIESLHVSFRTENMEPAACLEDLDNGAIYHLDRFINDSLLDIYKLLVYLDKDNLSKGPDIIMDVTERKDAVGEWSLECSYNGDSIETILNCDMEEYKDKATVILNGKKEVHRVKPIYWLDLIDKNIRQSLF